MTVSQRPYHAGLTILRRIFFIIAPFGSGCGSPFAAIGRSPWLDCEIVRRLASCNCEHDEGISLAQRYEISFHPPFTDGETMCNADERPHSDKLEKLTL